MGTLKIVYKSIDEIKPYGNNPRFNDEAVEYVAESIKQFGFKVPMVITSENVIVTGHTRFKASQRLGLNEVPCVIADDLTEDEIKAFRLADNKVSEFSKWDNELLHEEISKIDYDLEPLGFEIDYDLPELEPPKKENERLRTDREYNLDLVDHTRLDGKFEMPIISKETFIPDDLVGFNYMLTNKNKNVGIHCFVDDYQFERLWDSPYDYVDKLREYDCFLTPDFSLYMDMPLVMKAWNIYRSRLLGQFYQDCGITVIPTISWAEKATFEFCFDGIEKGGTVAVSTIGVKRSKEAMAIWTAGMDKMIKRIQPSTILVYGGEVEYDYGNIKVVYYDNKVTERMKNYRVDKG